MARDPRHRVTDASDHAHRRLDDRSRFVVGGDVAPLRELGGPRRTPRRSRVTSKRAPARPAQVPPPHEPITVSLANLVPQDHFYRHLEVTLDRPFVREGCRGCRRAGSAPEAAGARRGRQGLAAGSARKTALRHRG